jgi:hypothetical protein
MQRELSVSGGDDEKYARRAGVNERAAGWHVCARICLWLAQQKSAPAADYAANTAQARGSAGWLEAAHRMFRTAIRLDPALAAAHRDLAVLLLQLEPAQMLPPPLEKLRAVHHALQAATLERHTASSQSVGWLVLATALDESRKPLAALWALRQYLRAQCAGDGVECRGAHVRTAVSELWRLCQAQAACWEWYDADLHRLRLLVANEIRSCRNNGGLASEPMTQRYSVCFLASSPLLCYDPLHSCAFEAMSGCCFQAHALH